MSEPQDDLFDDTEESQDDDLDQSGETTPPDDAENPTDSTNSDKRVNDLMAKFRKEQARANKAEAALAAATGGGDASQPKSDEDSSSSSEDEFKAYMRETVRKQMLSDNPELKDYGLSASDITGDSPAEMQASVNRHKALIKKIAGTAQQKVLTEHGLSPDIGGSVADGPKDWASMPKDEFEKAVQQALNAR